MSPAPTAVAFFDIDNTLLKGASLFHLARGMHKGGLVSNRDIARFAWKARHFARHGENLSHLDEIRARATELASGIPVVRMDALAREIYDRYTESALWPESVALARQHIAEGHEVWLLSATPQVLAGLIAERLGLTGAGGTKLVEVDGHLTGEIDGKLMHGAQKAVIAAEIAERAGVEPGECWAYSDSLNDLPLLNFAGHPSVVNPDRGLREHALANGWPILEHRGDRKRA
ncbi:HAD family hydrolase [Amnibacterium flavum]|uniref:HAD-IB family hydrolase n=1 Tax=Amnibacterium flavum TaxID=2173173 RepID=A0A2V1HWF1_9MICO|nr:HAD-IB family hydrolase [Amnibacterium flavum]PVZ94524.1 HAD-IB family hydrolase [Amnibacterium flavum]